MKTASIQDASSKSTQRLPPRAWNRRTLIRLACAWLALLVLAAVLDQQVATSLSHHPLFHRKAHWVAVIKAPGDFRFTLVVAALLWAFHRDHPRPAVALLLSGILGGVMYLIIKWVIGRERPIIAVHPWNFHPFPDGLKGFFTRGGLSFPSGHACLSFATATILALAIPRWRWLWFAMAGVVALERVAENAHYPSDAVGGAALGIVCALTIWRMI